MDFEHFAEWIKCTSRTLQNEHGRNANIIIIIDNATWHNQLTPESQPAKRSWKKSLVVEWLTNKSINYETYMRKAEILELAFEHLPPRQYVIDKISAQYSIQILRISIKHWVLNLIELAWASLKSM